MGAPYFELLRFDLQVALHLYMYAGINELPLITHELAICTNARPRQPNTHARMHACTHTHTHTQTHTHTHNQKREPASEVTGATRKGNRAGGAFWTQTNYTICECSDNTWCVSHRVRERHTHRHTRTHTRGCDCVSFL